MRQKPSRAETDRDGLPTTDHMDRLVAAVENLTREMKVIREILDRILDDFQWALNNDRFGPDCFPKTAALSKMLADANEAEDRADEVSATDDMAARSPAATQAPGARRELF